MRSAQSRLGVVTSLGAAREGLGRCTAALPVPPSALRIGAATLAGLAGAVLVRGLFSSRKKKAAPVAAVAAAAPAAARSMNVLLSETALTLLLPLLRRYFLGGGFPGAASKGGADTLGSGK